MTMKTWMKQAACSSVAALLLLGCSSEISKSAAPVELIATNTQNLSRIDIATGASGCNVSAGTIELQAILKNPGSQSTTQTFNQVHVTSYTVSYERTDGGKTVPAPYTTAMDALLTPGSGTTSLPTFQVLRSEALNQAPFAALQPQNGGRDPDTLQPIIRMNIVVTVFGQTLAGENVSTTTRIPMAFCYQCGGCA